jgi:ubiquinone/menaquinone biosynthesis C-methylase UbiE
MENRATYDRIYRERAYDVASVYDHIIRIRQRYLNDMRGRALDHGFGNGVIASYLAREGFDVYGIETSASALEVVRERAAQLGLRPDRFTLIGAEQTRFDYPENFFDVIVSNQTIYFMPRAQIDATLREFHRILVPGAKFACTTMAHENYWITTGTPREGGMVHVKLRGRITRDFDVYSFPSEAAVRAAWEQAGFVVDDLGYFDFKLLDVTCAKHWIILAHKPAS